MKRKRKINVGETQITVSCPARIQRRILRNMVRSTRDRVNLTCAQKSRELLKTINSQPKQGDAQAETSAAAKTAGHSAQNRRAKISQIGKSMFQKCTHRVFLLFKSARRLLRAVGGYAFRKKMV